MKVIRTLAIGVFACIALVAAPVAQTTATPSFNGRIAFVAETGIGSVNPDGTGAWPVDMVPGDANPVWSPDGTRIAFVSNRNGDADIWSMAPDGSDQKNLTFSYAYDQWPVWSPDGKQIAFVSYRASDYGIFVMNADGSDQHLLVGGVVVTSRMSWSPDGKLIAYAGFADDGEGIFVVSGADAKPRRITSPVNAFDAYPAWSPDGTKIAFDRDEQYNGQPQIYLVNSDGTGLTELTKDPGSDSHPAWSPDGTQIAFQSERLSKHVAQIFVMNADGSNQHVITSGSGSSSPSWQRLGAAPEGQCTLWGTPANDVLVGGDTASVICGGAGDDTLIGGARPDRLVGGDGNDVLAGGPGVDILEGGAGNDTIDVRDGFGDFVNGGDGTDKVVSDWSGDFASDVELRTRSLNIAAWRPATAASWEPTNPPALAFDGATNDWWNSGGPAPKWIEIDLGAVRRVAEIRLDTGAQPIGVVRVLGKGADPRAVYRTLHVFRGPTGPGDVLRYRPKRPWHGVQYLRFQSLTMANPWDWIAWPEIEVLAPRR